MVTHDPRYAACADRTIRLFDGRVVEESLQTANVAATLFTAGTHQAPYSDANVRLSPWRAARARSSVDKHQPSKLRVAGSSPAAPTITSTVNSII